ncbi:MAG: glycosyltransferase family 4 protein [Clostridiales bacterium]|nr:glycosyltransferase family 4 protein [Clostridiales bacterium]
MKILIIRVAANKLNLRTYNVQEVGLAKALVRKGHQCDVMYYTDQKQESMEEVIFDNDKRVRIIWSPGIRIFQESYYPSLKSHINDYDVVQIGGYNGVTSCWLNRKHQNKTVNFQGPYYYKKNRKDRLKTFVWDHTLLPLSHKRNMIVATKSKLATDHVKSKGIKNVTTIGIGLDLGNLVSSDDAYSHEFVRQLSTQKGNNKYLLYIGAIEDRRNILFMLELFHSVHKKLQNTRLILIGKGKDDYVQNCKERIKLLGLDEFIIWQESLEQKYLKPVYEISDAFLLPTKYEIFGMVLLEAMYFGLPVFTTYNGGSSTLMDEGNGIVIEKFDVDVWSEKICEVLADVKKRKNIGLNAHRTIEDYYTWDKLADKFLEVYRMRLCYLKEEQ